MDPVEFPDTTTIVVNHLASELDGAGYDIGVYSDGTVAILAAISGDPVAIDSPATLTTLPVGVRPLDAVTAICKWRNPIVDIGDPGDFGDALVAVQTTGEVQVMDHTGTLAGSDEVDPLIVGRPADVYEFGEGPGTD